MSITIEPPSVEGPDAGVIEEARARQRRHRGIAGAALVAAAIAALVATSSGGWGGSSHPATGPVRPARPPSTATSTLLAACSRAPHSVHHRNPEPGSARDPWRVT